MKGNIYERITHSAIRVWLEYWKHIAVAATGIAALIYAL